MEDSTLILIGAAALAGGYYWYTKKKKQTASSNTASTSELKDKASESQKTTTNTGLTKQAVIDIFNELSKQNNTVGSSSSNPTNEANKSAYDSLIATYLATLADNKCYAPMYIYVKTSKPWNAQGFQAYVDCFGKSLTDADDTVKANFTQFCEALFPTTLPAKYPEDATIAQKFEIAKSYAAAHVSAQDIFVCNLVSELFDIYTIVASENSALTLADDDWFYFFDGVKTRYMAVLTDLSSLKKSMAEDLQVFKNTWTNVATEQQNNAGVTT